VAKTRLGGPDEEARQKTQAAAAATVHAKNQAPKWCAARAKKNRRGHVAAIRRWRSLAWRPSCQHPGHLSGPRHVDAGGTVGLLLHLRAVDCSSPGSSCASETSVPSWTRTAGRERAGQDQHSLWLRPAQGGRAAAGSPSPVADPFAQKRTPRGLYLSCLCFAGLAALWWLGHLDRYLPDKFKSDAVLDERSGGDGAAADRSVGRFRRRRRAGSRVRVRERGVSGARAALRGSESVGDLVSGSNTLFASRLPHRRVTPTNALSLTHTRPASSGDRLYGHDLLRLSPHPPPALDLTPDPLC